MLSFFPRDVSDEILNLIESVSEGFPSYSFNKVCHIRQSRFNLNSYSFGLPEVSIKGLVTGTFNLKRIIVFLFRFVLAT